jgi:hypothetical protein
MKSKNIFLAALFCAVVYAGSILARPEIALSGGAQVAQLQALGMATELAARVDSLYSSAVPVAPVYSSGVNAQLAAYVPTLAATPAAGTNQYLPGLNIIPTNAANNAGFLGVATPVVGQQFRIVNASGAAQRIKAAGGATLNGVQAGGFISIASLATVDCITAAAGNQVCLQPVIPTPQAP